MPVALAVKLTTPPAVLIVAPLGVGCVTFTAATMSAAPFASPSFASTLIASGVLTTALAASSTAIGARFTEVILSVAWPTLDTWSPTVTV